MEWFLELAESYFGDLTVEQVRLTYWGQTEGGIYWFQRDRDIHWCVTIV